MTPEQFLDARILVNASQVRFGRLLGLRAGSDATRQRQVMAWETGQEPVPTAIAAKVRRVLGNEQRRRNREAVRNRERLKRAGLAVDAR